MVDLALELSDGDNGLGARFTYNSDLFDAASIRRMAEHFRTLIQSAVEAPDKTAADLPFMTEAERRRVVLEWNETSRQYPRGRRVHELFEDQAARVPDHQAVRFDGVSLTYSQLNSLANRLASRLRSEGLGFEVPVGVCFEPSPQMVVALLAVWKAGGAWVALDPTWPRERLAFVARDSGCVLLLTDGAAAQALSQIVTKTWTVGLEPEPTGTENLPASEDASRLAYVLYTSGSTGGPTGVAVEHRSVVNYLLWVNESLFSRRPLAMPVVSGLSFDASLKQLFAPLLRGDPVWILSRDVAARPDVLRRVLSSAGPVALNCVPALWSALLEDLRTAPPEESLNNLKVLFLGGERLASKLVADTLVALPHLEIWNLYGPTETTANATAARIRSAEDVQIGRPIANARAYVLDEERRLLPVGVAGELFVGGDGVARGYWKQNQLTQARFFPDPFCGDPTARMYRTGDLVRQRRDGTLEFLGRLDDQVKVRGHRVEPAEIEAVLTRHVDVREAAVRALDGPLGEAGLVAYVAIGPAARCSVGQLKEFLRQHLPEAMVPRSVVLIERLPRLSNGKVDRLALPEPLEAATEESSQAPATPTERTLAALWAELLRTDRIGVRESFFDRGGHSLLAAQVVTRIRQIFGVEVPLRSLFEAPTVVELAKRIEALGSTVPSGQTALPKAPRDQPIPLAFPQERLWFLSQLEPGNPFYNVFKAIRLNGRLDAEALARSVDAIVERHDSLRTCFPVVDGVPHQEIRESTPGLLAVRDISGVPHGDREAEALRIASEEAEKPFDLSLGPLIRAVLLRLGSEDHILLLTIHHIVCDGWSLGIFFRELALAYDAFRTGKLPELAPLAMRYADFAFWQRRWLDGDVLDSRLKYWRRRLEGAPQVLELPTDRPRPPRPSYRGSREFFAFPSPLCAALRELGRREGATLFMTLLACFQTLLSRYTGASDVIVGSPIANRSWRETEDLIGFFINTLVLRSNLSQNPSFRQLLRTVRDSSLEDYAHQDIPFEKLIEELRPERTTSYPPIFQVLFVLQSGPPADPRLSGLTLTPLRADSGRTKFDLTVSLRERGEGLEGIISYSTDLFDAETIQTMARHFQSLAESAVRNPDHTVGDLALLSVDEGRRILFEWNQTDTRDPETDVLDLVSRQAEHRPEDVAIESSGESVTYRELVSRARRLAARLRATGFVPEQLAGLCADRSPEMIVGMLGILEAGGAYLPIDPLLPPRRIDFLLEDAKPRLVVAPAGIASRLPDRGLAIVSPDGSLDSDRSLEMPPTGHPSLDRLAYVIYTSGSTGRPKGVEVTHRALANFVFWARDAFELAPSDRVLQFAPFHFDTSVEEIFPCLASGATLVLRTDAMLESPATFFKACTEKGITVLDLPTAYWHELVPFLERGDVQLPPCLRLVIIGGEGALPERLVQWHSAVGQRVRLLNTYGPTEATVAATIADLTPAESAQSASVWRVPIGRPIDNVRAYVLDPRRQPVPIGVRGELFLGGEGLARGYRNDPVLTARRFTPDRYSDAPGARLYRTGDLVRRRRDGTLEFLGRVDDQVKIRGFRVEPVEVEKVLVTYPSISDVAVIAREDVPGDRRLVAYFSKAAATEPSVSELRDFLAQRLPDYLIPQAFVCLEKLPRTLAGKLDRAVLPAPRRASALAGDRRRPDNSLERLVANAWCQVFGFERVGLDEDFFELGGHSLMATRVLSRLRAQIPLDLPLRLLFEHPTVAGMSRAIAQIAHEKGGQRELAGAARQ
jgi:amino acid adenylation domain-containing protein